MNKGNKKITLINNNENNYIKNIVIGDKQQTGHLNYRERGWQNPVFEEDPIKASLSPSLILLLGSNIFMLSTVYGR